MTGGLALDCLPSYHQTAMTEAIWAIVGFLLGWKSAGAAGGNPAAVPSAATSAVKNTVRQAVTQASDTVWSAVWSVAWHVIPIGAVLLALLAAGSLVVRWSRKNVFGR